MDKLIHYTYIITDHINQKYYYGVHSSTDPFDITKYHGSSNRLNSEIKRLGIQNFSKEVRRIFKRRDLANNWESKVHRRLNIVNDPRFYNMVNGNPCKYMIESNKVLSEKHLLAIRSPESRVKLSKAKIGRKLPTRSKEWCDAISKGKKHKPLSEAHKLALQKPKTMTPDYFKNLSERVTKLSNNPQHIRIKNSIGRVFINLSTKEHFFVLNMTVFGREHLKVEKLSVRVNQVLSGKRSHTFGFSVRLPTESETLLYKQQLVNTKTLYMKMY